MNDGRCSLDVGPVCGAVSHCQKKVKESRIVSLVVVAGVGVWLVCRSWTGTEPCAHALLGATECVLHSKGGTDGGASG